MSEAWLHLTLRTSCYANDYDVTEGVEAHHKRDKGVEFGDKVVGVSDACAEGL